MATNNVFNAPNPDRRKTSVQSGNPQRSVRFNLQRNRLVNDGRHQHEGEHQTQAAYRGGKQAAKDEH